MSLIKFNRRPWANLLPQEFFNTNEFFADRRWWNIMEEPAMNIKELKDGFEIELAAPGYSKKDFEIEIDNGCLNISAQNSSSKEREEDNYSRREFSYTSFKKSLQLPENVLDEEIKATYKDGILTCILSKKEGNKSNKPKKIEIS
ncbi:Hsp20/alpha crystallin family protein [Arenibacter sp. 6A1]|uniref:Hsp20/alpha crystallin family protein n=1 Tax=Arenibacter sp. 6A1 TaxID=2720391 RepID=UPI00144707FF|nr:Hsp20/alpha crystallin family protein [Arenibacter sp. 6A1]NKI25769.1 Hsp20/alpha crystallin family protein [Arenibacter sp. 6A1]